MKIVKQTKISELLHTYPYALAILERHKVACRHCHFTRQETLGDLATQKHIPFSQLAMEIRQMIENMS